MHPGVDHSRGEPVAGQMGMKALILAQMPSAGSRCTSQSRPVSRLGF